MNHSGNNICNETSTPQPSILYPHLIRMKSDDHPHKSLKCESRRANYDGTMKLQDDELLHFVREGKRTLQIVVYKIVERNFMEAKIMGDLNGKVGSG